MASVIPLSAHFAIREAVLLLRASRRNFKSRQVEQARQLLETLLELEGIPIQLTPQEIYAQKTDAPDAHPTQKNRVAKTDQHHD